VNELDEVVSESRILKMETRRIFDKVKMLPKLAELGSFFPKSVKTGRARK